MEFDKIYKFPDSYYSIKNSKINGIYVNLIHNPSRCNDRYPTKE